MTTPSSTHRLPKGSAPGGANVDESFGTDPRFRAPFDPDSIWNYEIGSKASFLARTLTLNTALFYIDWKNIQIDQPIVSLINPPVGFIVLNGQTAHSYGIETDIYGIPRDSGPSARAALAQRGVRRWCDQLARRLLSLKGQVLPSTPEYTANASVERRFNLGAALEAYVRGDYTLRGSSFGDVPNDPTTDIFGEGNSASGASKITNLRAGVRRDTWDLQVFCTNVFDTHASTYTLFDGGFTDLRAILPPRMLGVSLRVQLQLTTIERGNRRVQSLGSARLSHAARRLSPA